MKHTPKEIINALQVIQDECESHTEGCSECPLYTGGECKIVVKEEPTGWNLNINDWKAFVD